MRLFDTPFRASSALNAHVLLYLPLTLPLGAALLHRSGAVDAQDVSPSQRLWRYVLYVVERGL